MDPPKIIEYLFFGRRNYRKGSKEKESEYFLFLEQLLEVFGDVFSEYIELEVHHASLFKILEVGMLVGVWNNGHREGAIAGIDYREADAIYANGALLDGDISFQGIVVEGEYFAAIHVGNIGADGSLVHMPIHQMAIQPSIHQHASLEVDRVTDLYNSQVCFQQGFFDGCNGIKLFFDAIHSEADAVVGNTLVYLQLLNKGSMNMEFQVGMQVFNMLDYPYGFDDSCEHIVLFFASN